MEKYGAEGRRSWKLFRRRGKMIHAGLILRRFNTLQEFEIFALDLAETCCKVNKSSRNKNEVDRWRKAVEARQNEAK